MAATVLGLLLASGDSSGGPPGECPEGKEKSADTAGHCCWAGQVWSSFKCVGVPTACPKGRKLDRVKEQCVLEDCAPGMVRPPNDREQCCWPGQAWSKVRNMCVGVPKSCPKTHEIQGETCVSLDIDGDGIPNKFDKCPTEPEDYNGFEDADGCPDQAKLDAKRAAEAAAAKAAQEAAERAEREKREAAERAERERIEAEERRKAAVAAEEEARRQEREARIAAARRKAADNRADGRLCVGWGIVSLAGMGVFLGVGAAENGRIQSGGFKTADDISHAATVGKAMNVMAGIFGVAGGALVAVGIPVIAVNHPPRESAIAGPATPHAEITAGPGGLGARGSF